MSDVILDSDQQVTVLGSNLNVQGHDFLLDSPDRRQSAGSRFRRALVHDQNDGLTINFAGDYPGGVTLVNLNTLETLHVRGDITFGMPGVRAGTPGIVLVPVSLAKEIDALHSLISELSAKVAALEARR
jgi:hypothetical protein